MIDRRALRSGEAMVLLALAACGEVVVPTDEQAELYDLLRVEYPSSLPGEWVTLADLVDGELLLSVDASCRRWLWGPVRDGSASHRVVRGVRPA